MLERVRGCSAPHTPGRKRVSLRGCDAFTPTAEGTLALFPFHFTITFYFTITFPIFIHTRSSSYPKQEPRLLIRASHAGGPRIAKPRFAAMAIRRRAWAHHSKRRPGFPCPPTFRSQPFARFQIPLLLSSYITHGALGGPSSGGGSIPGRLRTQGAWVRAATCGLPSFPSIGSCTCVGLLWYRVTPCLLASVTESFHAPSGLDAVRSHASGGLAGVLVFPDASSPRKSRHEDSIIRARHISLGHVSALRSISSPVTNGRTRCLTRRGQGTTVFGISATNWI